VLTGAWIIIKQTKQAEEILINKCTNTIFPEHELIGGLMQITGNLGLYWKNKLYKTDLIAHEASERGVF
jgi:hypothetical protein